MIASSNCFVMKHSFVFILRSAKNINLTIENIAKNEIFFKMKIMSLCRAFPVKMRYFYSSKYSKMEQVINNNKVNFFFLGAY